LNIFFIIFSKNHQNNLWIFKRKVPDEYIFEKNNSLLENISFLKNNLSAERVFSREKTEKLSF
jgi:hypothetical protein